jgi:translocation and assembly module TamA
LVFALVASAALLVLDARSPAWAAPKAEVQGQLDQELRRAIETAVGETDRPIPNRFAARRRAMEAGEDAIAVLRSEGYYAYDVETDVGEGDTPSPRIAVKPGPRFNFAAPAVTWLGAPPQADVREAGESAMRIIPGTPGRAAEVVAAEGRIVAAVQKRGHADAAVEPREVIVDHADKTVRPTFRIVAGDLVRLDGITLISRGRTTQQWLDRLATWKSGEVYDPEDVAELERRLLDTGVYEAATVSLGTPRKDSPHGLRPVIVSLTDRERRTLELGAAYSTTEGVGVEGRWTRYNTLGRADTLSAVGQLSTIDSELGVELKLPHWLRPQQTLTLSGAAYHKLTDAYNETGVGLEAEIQRRFRKTSFLTLGATLDFGRTEEVQTRTLSSLGRDLMVGAAYAVLSLDRSDDPLNPRKGWRLESRLEPTVLVGEGVRPYLKVQSQGAGYLPFGQRARTVLAGRVKLGSLIGGTIPDVPASRRFYAGGGGSVRGYSYQAVGPRLADNTPQGGASLLEASAELRQQLTRRWSVVGFLDAGAVGTDQFPTGKDLSVGAGLGVRYDLGFGPIRADVAIPLDKRSGDPAFQVYLSIGQSF